MGWPFDSKLQVDTKKYAAQGQSLFDQGQSLTNEGLTGLRDLNSTYAADLKNPLGTGPNSASGIFNRTRGALTDTATRSTSNFGARLFQQARQGGGTLSPEAQAQLAEQNQRETNQSLFEGNVAISDKEAAATLTETSKLFDRMESINKTILGVGADSRNNGLAAILNTLNFRYAKDAQKRSILSSFANSLVGGAAGGASSGGSAGAGKGW